MRSIDIAEILSLDLKFRMRIQDHKLYVENCGSDAEEIDFQNVKFATRSFMDEFYNLFLKDAKASSFAMTITNVAEDIKAMLDSVSRTQVAKVIPAYIPKIVFKNENVFLQYIV